MTITLAVLLGIVQGLTEFLPVSSSGHLVVSRHLLGSLFGTIEAPLAFDVLVHVATGLVTAFFLRTELIDMVKAFFARTAFGAKVRSLSLLVVVATLPAVVAGLLFKDRIEQSFTSMEVALNGFLITAVLLESAHRRQVKLGAGPQGGIDSLDWQLPTVAQALVIGLAQACAIIPGISRSGSTIAVALLLGLGAVTAVRFSFFLLLPVVFGALVLQLDELAGFSAESMPALFCGFLVTAAVAYGALHSLVWLVQGAKLRYFAVYTLILGTLLRVF